MRQLHVGRLRIQWLLKVLKMPKKLEKALQTAGLTSLKEKFQAEKVIYGLIYDHL